MSCRSRPPAAEGYSIESFVADVHGLLGALGLTRTVVIGHSLGGVVAYLFAARYPHLVTALVVEDVGLLYPREPVEVRRPEGGPAFDWTAVMALRGQIDEPDPRWREQARGITVPALLVSGGPSSYVRGETITRWAGALARAEVVTIDIATFACGEIWMSGRYGWQSGRAHRKLCSPLWP